MKLDSGTIMRPKQLPLEKLTVRVLMKDSVLSLEPLDFGLAGGRLHGPVRLDGRSGTIVADAALRVDKLQLAKLFPTLKESQGSLGTLGGAVRLKGRGNSVKDMLGTSNGSIALYMDGGRISRALMEIVALDLVKFAQVKLKGDEPVDVRCAIADLTVKDGLANVNAMVIDTGVVNVLGGGSVNLKSEALDLKIDPKPKRKSIGSLNSPFHVRGTFSAPRVSPDAELVGRGVGAIVLGVLNPLLAVIPLINDGPGEDSPCGQLVAEALAKTQAATKAASSGQSAAAGGSAPRRPAKSAN